MKAYKVTLLVIDHDNVGDNIKDMIENQKFPNYCINPIVTDVQSSDIGEWSDDHLLNKRNSFDAEFERLFGRNSIVAEIEELIEKYLLWRELVSKILNDTPEKFMERVRLIGEVDELAKKIQKTL